MIYTHLAKHMPRVARLFVLVSAFAILFVVGIGCNFEGEQKKIPSQPDEAQHKGVPIEFEVLRKVMTEPLSIVECDFKNEVELIQSADIVGLSNVELVIKSQAELNAYLTCADSIAIDFSKEYVFAGKSRGHSNQVQIDSIGVEMINGSVFFRVGLLNSYLNSPSTSEYIVKVNSREYVDYPVVFDVYWENDL